MNNWTEFLKKLPQNPKLYVAAVVAAITAANGILQVIPDAYIVAVVGFLTALGFYHKPTDLKGDTEDVNPPQ